MMSLKHREGQIFKRVVMANTWWHNIAPLSNQVDVITYYKCCILLQFTFTVVVINGSRRTEQEAVVGLFRKYLF